MFHVGATLDGQRNVFTLVIDTVEFAADPTKLTSLSLKTATEKFSELESEDCSAKLSNRAWTLGPQLL